MATSKWQPPTCIVPPTFNIWPLGDLWTQNGDQALQHDLLANVYPPTKFQYLTFGWLLPQNGDLHLDLQTKVCVLPLSFNIWPLGDIWRQNGDLQHDLLVKMYPSTKFQYLTFGDLWPYFNNKLMTLNLTNIRWNMCN